MIETIMLIGLGFLTAALAALLMAPPIWRRAVRITTKQIQSRSPLTMAEIQAERDQMQAEFAQTTRRLEVAIAELKQKTVGQAVMISRGSAEIDVLGSKLSERTEALNSAVKKLATLNQRQEPLTKNLTALRAALAEQEDAIGALKKRNGELSDRFANSETVRKEQAKALARLEKASRKRSRKGSAASTKADNKAKADATDPVYDELSKETDKLAVFAEEIPLRLNGLKHREEQLYAQKLSLDDQRIVSHEDAMLHKTAIEKYQEERDRLRQDVADAHTNITTLQDDVARREAHWQQDHNNPFLTLRESLHEAGQVLAGSADTLEAEFSPEEVDIAAEVLDPVKKIQTANGEDADDGAGIDTAGQQKAHPRSGSLADRIRALQDQINQ